MRLSTRQWLRVKTISWLSTWSLEVERLGYKHGLFWLPALWRRASYLIILGLSLLVRRMGIKKGSQLVELWERSNDLGFCTHVVHAQQRCLQPGPKATQGRTSEQKTKSGNRALLSSLPGSPRGKTPQRRNKDITRAEHKCESAVQQTGCFLPPICWTLALYH